MMIVNCDRCTQSFHRGLTLIVGSSPLGVTETVNASEKVQDWLSNPELPGPVADVFDT